MEIQHFNIQVTSEECGYTRIQETAADLTAYLLAPLSQAPDRLRPAVVICPGGGYGFVSQREDQPVALAYAAAGFQAFVLHYNVAPEVFPLSLMELARSVAFVRQHAGQWHIDPERIFVCGFSAGGHLACSLGMFWKDSFLTGPLGLSPEDVRPTGMILSYPVITAGPMCHPGSFENLLGQDAGEQGTRNLVSLELQAGPDTPPAFIWHTWTDQSVPVDNSLLLAQALRNAGVSAELHIYPEGKHGLSLANMEVSDDNGDCLIPVCQEWMEHSIRWCRQLAIPSGKGGALC